MRSFLLLVVSIAGFAFVSCAGDSDGAGGSAGGAGGESGLGGGGAGGDGGSGSKKETKDTSDYKGRLTWSRAVRLGVYLWDLPSSELVFHREFGEGVVEEKKTGYSAPTLSADGSTMAFAVESNYLLTSNQSQVEILDVAAGVLVPYTTKGLAANHFRHTVHPSLSGDGRRVAVAEAHAELIDEVPSNPSALSIEVWDRDADVRIRVTDGDAMDSLPILSADGTRVFFVSDRDDEVGDFYIADVEEDASVERLSYKKHDAIKDLEFALYPGQITATADLRWVTFRAITEEGISFFILDTSNGSIEQLDIQPRATLSEKAVITRHGVTISADGSTLAFSLHYLDVPEEGPVVSAKEILVAPRENPTDLAVVHVSEEPALLHGLALSADGSQIAYTDGASTLWVSGVDGSNPRLVASRDDKWVGPDFTGSMSLSF